MRERARETKNMHRARALPLSCPRCKCIADAQCSLHVLSPAPHPAAAAHKQTIIQRKVSSTVQIARQVAAQTGKSPPPVYPFAWECYRNATTLLTLEHLEVELLSPYNAGADGVVVWGYLGQCVGNQETTSLPTRVSARGPRWGGDLSRGAVHVACCSRFLLTCAPY